MSTTLRNPFLFIEPKTSGIKYYKLLIGKELITDSNKFPQAVN